MGAPIGNRNAQQGALIRNALVKALKKRSFLDKQSALRRIYEKVVDMALEGDKWAVEHIADRVDGKATQRVEQRIENTHLIGSSDELSTSLQTALAKRTAPEKPSVQ